MDAEAVINELKKRYPGKTIIKLPKDKPAEIICEIEPVSGHSDFSIAIAVITGTAPHYNDGTETYEVLKGDLVLTLDKQVLRLKPEDKCVIRPGVIHSTKANGAWVKVTTRPGWTPSGHHLI
jgi:mannose-6-phosphate isomerase-like protein (cupin superfamily)